jgi:hypothetical protein
MGVRDNTVSSSSRHPLPQLDGESAKSDATSNATGNQLSAIAQVNCLRLARVFARPCAWGQTRRARAGGRSAPSRLLPELNQAATSRPSAAQRFRYQRIRDTPRDQRATYP